MNPLLLGYLSVSIATAGGGGLSQVVDNMWKCRGAGHLEVQTVITPTRFKVLQGLKLTAKVISATGNAEVELSAYMPETCARYGRSFYLQVNRVLPHVPRTIQKLLDKLFSIPQLQGGMVWKTGRTTRGTFRSPGCG